MAGSPIRHESAVQGSAVEVQTYQPPWKTLSEFALQSDLDQPAFQQLVRPRPARATPGLRPAFSQGRVGVGASRGWPAGTALGGRVARGRLHPAPQRVIRSNPDLPGLTRSRERSRDEPARKPRPGTAECAWGPVRCPRRACSQPAARPQGASHPEPRPGRVLTTPTWCPQVSFSESGSLGNSSGSDVTSLSSQLPDTPNSMVPSPVET